MSNKKDLNKQRSKPAGNMSKMQIFGEETWQGICFLIFAFLLWFILSGNSEFFFLACGAVSAILSLMIYHLLNLRSALTTRQNFKFFAAISYVFWLLAEIIKSTQTMVKIIWQPNLKISPCYGYIPTILKGAANKTIYASSITLTPGTLTVKLDDDRMIIHALRTKFFEDVLEGSMERKILKLQAKHD